VLADPQFFFEQIQRMDEQITAFDQAFRPGEQSPPATQANDTPRHVPWPTEATAAGARPWSPEVLNSGQLQRTPGAQQLLYAPTWDLYLRHPANPRDKRLLSGGQFVDELDQDDSSGSDVHLANGCLPDENIDPPPPPDPVGPPSQIANRNGGPSRKTTKARKLGGRRHQPLNSHSRHNAKLRRARGQCWSCTLQRNPCEFENEGDKECIGCKRKRKPTLITGCLCIRLTDLAADFIPASLIKMHELNKLLALTRTHVHRWLDNHFIVLVTWGHPFRPIKVDVTEIELVGKHLLFQNQYRLNVVTDKYDLFQIPSPPLAIMLMAVDVWRVNLDAYLEGILRDDFRRFPAVCFRGDACRVERDLLIPIIEYHEAATGRTIKKQDLVHQALKLVLLTFIMTHSLTIVENTKDDVYKRLKNKPENLFGHHTSARWVNKQIKFLLSALHTNVLKEVLNKVQDTLRLSTKKDLWAPLFASMVILAMTTETLQVTVRCKEDTDKQEGTIEQDDRTADKEIELMDERFDLLRRLFHQGYRTLLHKGLNPLQDLTVRAGLDNASQSLAAMASEIVETYHTFLVARQVLRPPTTTSDPQTARLVAKFLLCFSPPVEQNQPHPAVAASTR
ncbi:MAG: hypothetical protein Q9226_008412, partial [Calogaya cf. arnoldii]